MSNIQGFKDLSKQQKIDTRKDRHNKKSSEDNDRGTFVNMLSHHKYQSSNNKDQANFFNISVIQQKRVLFLSGRRPHKPPSDQNYWNMLNYTCCPVIKLFSLTIILLVIYIGVFIAECIAGINKSGELLQVKLETAILMGANVPSLVRAGQVWRVIVAAVLHVNFLHFLGNFVSTLIITSRIQHTLGSLRLLILYLLAAIGANFFSGLIIFDSIKLGASTCLYGALGYCLGYLIINWSALGLISEILRCQMLCITLFLVIFGLLFTSIADNIDYLGHLGGFIVGVLGSSLGQRISEEKDCSRKIRIIFSVILGIFLVLIIILFYTVR